MPRMLLGIPERRRNMGPNAQLFRKRRGHDRQVLARALCKQRSCSNASPEPGTAYTHGIHPEFRLAGGARGIRTLGPSELICTKPLFGTNNDALTSPRVPGILETSAADAASRPVRIR